MDIIARLRKHRRIVLVWSFFLLRGLFYTLLFPVWEGYDEYPHFAFVQYLASGHGLPSLKTPVSREVEESLKLVPLPWMLRDSEGTTHDEYWKLPKEERDRREHELALLPEQWAAEAGSARQLNWEAQQPPLYYWILSVPLRLAWRASLPARVVLLRLVGMVLVSMTIPLIFLIFSRVFDSARTAIGMTALVAIMPELMVDICRVGNDSLGLLVYCLLILAGFRFMDRPDRMDATVVLALCLGTGLLTKAYFLTAVPATALLPALSARRAKEIPLRHRFVRYATGAGIVVGISGWWYWRNYVLTGTLSGVISAVALHGTPLWTSLQQIPRVDWRNAIDSIMVSHIWFGNWSFLQVRSWMYHLFMAVSFLSIPGVAAILILPRMKRKEIYPFLAARRHFLFLLSLYGFFWAGLLYHVLTTFLGWGVSASTGWYMYCLIPAEVAIIGAGLMALSPVCLRNWVIPGVTAAFGLLDLYTVHFYFIPYYTGLISHRVNGTLPAFHLGQLANGGWEQLSRLALHKQMIGWNGLVLVWACYILATIGLVVLGISEARATRTGSPL